MRVWCGGDVWRRGVSGVDSCFRRNDEWGWWVMWCAEGWRGLCCGFLGLGMDKGLGITLTLALSLRERGL